MSGVAFLDVETTGLDPVLHEIWEVGLIVPSDGIKYSTTPGRGTEPQRFTEHVWHLPVDLARADPIALNIGHFHDRYVTTPDVAVGRGADSYHVRYRSTAEFAREFVRLTRGLHLCGAVVSFEAERLWKLLRANGECPMWHYHLIDVEALVVGYLRCQWRGYEDSPNDEARTKALVARLPWKSEDLSRAVGVDPDQFDRHSALGDARWAAAMYRAVMGPDA